MYVAMARLELRSGAELGSSVIGHVPVGTTLTVTGRRGLPDGTGRLCVKGLAHNLHSGWVNVLKDDGTDSLGYLAVGRHLTYWGRRVVSASPVHELAAEVPTGDAAATKVVVVYHDLFFHFSVCIKALAFVRNLQRRVTARAFDVPVVAFGKLTSSELQTTATLYAARAEAEEAKLASLGSSLEVRLGDALLQHKKKPKELAATWAVVGTRDVTKMEFRKHVRRTVDDSDVKDVDIMFDKLDEDKGGTLDTAELTTAMISMLQQAKASQEQREQVYKRMVRLREISATAFETAEITASAEAAEARLFESMDSFPIAARVGAVLLGTSTMSTKAVVNGWKSTNGEVNRYQFRDNLRSYGRFQAHDSELDELFDQFDHDGGGTLDIEELKRGLAMLRDEALDAKKARRALQRNSYTLWRATQDKQTELQELRSAHDEIEAGPQAGDHPQAEGPQAPPGAPEVHQA